MQLFAFIITAFSLLTFLSPAFASPVPAIEQARDIVIELNVREIPADREILRREPSAFAQSDTALDVPGADENITKVPQDLGARMCPPRGCY